MMVKRGIQKQHELLTQWLDSTIEPQGVYVSVDDFKQQSHSVLSLLLHMLVQGTTVDPSKRYMTLLAGFTHPFSRGSVHIASSSPETPPTIMQNYLTHPIDLKLLVREVQMILKVTQTAPAGDLIKSRVVPENETDEASRNT